MDNPETLTTIKNGQFRDTDNNQELTDTSIKNDGLKLVLSAQTSHLSEVKNSYNTGEVTPCALEGLNPLTH
jgi:phage terminase large subunit-like protein